VLAQHPDDLLLAEATPFHRPSPFQATDSTSFRLSFRGAGQVFYMIKQDLARLLYGWLGIKEAPVSPDQLRDLAIQKIGR
jgi:hypothetical protein